MFQKKERLGRFMTHSQAKSETNFTKLKPG